jgi:putative membrane protein insertion efficiency factor
MSDQDDAAIPYSAMALIISTPFDTNSVERFSWQAGLLTASPAVFLSVLAIRSYQVLLPKALKRRCIYTPTCSNYAIACLRLYGTIEGFRRAQKRIERCDSTRYKASIDLP